MFSLVDHLDVVALCKPMPWRKRGIMNRLGKDQVGEGFLDAIACKSEAFDLSKNSQFP